MNIKYIFKKYLPFIIILFLIVGSILFIFVSHYKTSREAANTTASSKLDMTIVKLEARIQATPSVVQNYIDLSNAYLQKVRETGDSTYYIKIDDLMNAAEKIDPTNANVSATRSSVAIGRHNFVGGKKYAEDALSKNKNREIYYGLLGDANIELGRYDEAVAAFQKMVDLRPGFSSYSRIAYIRELYGDISGAKETLNLATASGSNFKENVAWAYVELGKLDMRTNLDKADVDFKQALQILPTYSQANEGLGKVAFARGNTDEALAYFNTALSQLPLAQYSTDLADVYSAIGNTTKRDQYISVTEAAYNLAKSSGVNTDLEESLFLSDHDKNLDEAVNAGTRALAARPSEYASDYLAWAHFKKGDFVKAATFSKNALRLGDFDPLILFHQGMIAYKNGDTVHAKKYLGESYALNPNFSILYSSVLKSTLSQLK